MPSERVVWGPPGTGKTSTAIKLVRLWTEAGTDPSRIAFLAFTKAAAKAASVKVFETEDDTRMAEHFPYFRTVHSLCFQGMRKSRQVRLINTGDMKQFAQYYSMDGAYSIYDWEDLSEVYAQMKDQGRTEWDTALAAYQMSRVKARTLDDLEKAKVMPNNEGLMMLGAGNMSLNIYRDFVEKYETFKQADGLIDFTDMLEYGVKEMKPFDDIRYVVLDECVPAGTMITMSDGAEKKIETIKIGDEVIGYDHKSGFLQKSEVIEIRSREARKIVIIDDNLCLTENHPVFVVGRGYVKAGDIKPGDQIIALRRKEDLPRLRSDVLLPPSCCEKKSMVQDELLADRWLSGMEMGKTGLGKPEIKDFSRVRWGESQKLASNADRSEERKSFIEDGMAESPILEYRDHGEPRLCCEVHTVGSVEKVGINLPVYNIGTKTENYFAEGVLVHNCQDLSPIHHLLVDKLLSNTEEIWWIGDDDQSIYRFSGASAELFLERSKRARLQIQLRETHRFGQGIVDFSKQIISRVAHRHPKEIMGVSNREGRAIVTGEFEPIPGYVMIMHRHVMGCQNVAQAYVDAGIPFRNERGMDPLGSMKRIKAWQVIQELSKGKSVSAAQATALIEDGMKGHVVGEKGQKVEYLMRGAKAHLEERVKGSVNLKDLMQAKVLTVEGAQIIEQRSYDQFNFTNELRYYDRVVANGYELEYDLESEQKKVARITTIHGSKGRQAGLTVVFSEMGNKCWEDFDTEHRLAYVAATRTESDVLICVESKVNWARDYYDYPVEREAVQ